MENTNLPKTYNPKDFESRLYSKWVEDGLFKSSQTQIRSHLQ